MARAQLLPNIFMKQRQEPAEKRQQKAYALIDAAITFDTSSSDKQAAIKKYKNALLHLEQVFPSVYAFPLDGIDGGSLFLDRNGVALEKMTVTADKIRHRISDLEAEIPSEPVGRLLAKGPIDNSGPSNPIRRTVSNSTRSGNVRTAEPFSSSKRLAASNKRDQLSASNKSDLSELPAGVDKDFAARILDDLLVAKPNVSWEDIAGLESAKRILQESVILPALRPDLYTGLRSPSRGILLFGPPGTGKTMIAKALAKECNSNFFSLSASSLVSKYMGDSEKMVRTLFAVARYLGNSVLFFDELDSLLSKRKEDEHEASRRLKTEFLVQFDGVASMEGGGLVVVGATNRPMDLDEAVRRRFTQRIYVPLPEPETRISLLKHLLRKDQRCSITASQFSQLVEITNGYSCSDINALCKEASLYPLRDLSPTQLKKIKAESVRGIALTDFKRAAERIRPSVSEEDVEQVETWARQYGAT